MKLKSLCLKLAALANALVLIGGCVSYRAGLLKAPNEKPSTPADAPHSLLFMAGTKSDAGITGSLVVGNPLIETPQLPALTPPSQAETTPTVLLPGSKSPFFQNVIGDIQGPLLSSEPK